MPHLQGQAGAGGMEGSGVKVNAQPENIQKLRNSAGQENMDVGLTLSRGHQFVSSRVV